MPSHHFFLPVPYTFKGITFKTLWGHPVVLIHLNRKYTQIPTNLEAVMRKSPTWHDKHSVTAIIARCFSAHKKWKHHQPSHLHRCLLRHFRHCFRSTLRTALAALVDVGDWLESTRWDHSEDMTSNFVSMKDGKFYFSWSTMYIHI